MSKRVRRKDLRLGDWLWLPHDTYDSDRWGRIKHANHGHVERWTLVGSHGQMLECECGGERVTVSSRRVRRWDGTRVADRWQRSRTTDKTWDDVIESRRQNEDLKAQLSPLVAAEGTISTERRAICAVVARVGCGAWRVWGPLGAGRIWFEAESRDPEEILKALRLACEGLEAVLEGET